MAPSSPTEPVFENGCGWDIVLLVGDSRDSHCRSLLGDDEICEHLRCWRSTATCRKEGVCWRKPRFVHVLTPAAGLQTTEGLEKVIRSTSDFFCRLTCITSSDNQKQGKTMDTFCSMRFVLTTLILALAETCFSSATWGRQLHGGLLLLLPQSDLPSALTICLRLAIARLAFCAACFSCVILELGRVNFWRSRCGTLVPAKAWGESCA